MSAQYTSVAMNVMQVFDIHFRNLSYEVQLGYRKPKKQILKGLNGVFKGGELTAIMGPSGAGKSSLLNALTGFQRKNLFGTVEYTNRWQNKLNSNKMKKISCYIQQTDNLYDLFTVQESMMIASYLKIGNVTQKFRQMLIDNILNLLNLTKTRNTRVSGLSGGQKKRLSIALELIDNPPIMFLDEPTTGLDSLASLQCINALRNLAKSGRTIICTIHQPSAALYQMFDYVYLVVDGRCMYADVPDNTVYYFAKQGFQCPKYHNPADYMMEVVNHEYGNHDEWLIKAAVDSWQRDEKTSRQLADAEELANDKFAETARINPPSEMTKFRVLLYRSVLLLHRDWVTTHVKILSHFLVAILLGLMYKHAGDDASKTLSNVSFMFVSLLYLSYTSMMPAVLRFPLELDILRKERFNNWYQLRTYYVTTLLTNVPLQIFISFLYSTFSYVLTNQPMEWSRYLRFLLILSLTSLTSESLGLNFGTLFNPVNGTFFSAITLCVMFCLAGFLVFLNHMPVILYYVSYANYIRYAFHGLIQTIYGYHRDKLYCPNTYCHYRIPSALMEELNMIKPTFWIDVVTLIAYFVFFRVVGYKMLKRRLTQL